MFVDEPLFFSDSSDRFAAASAYTFGRKVFLLYLFPECGPVPHKIVIRLSGIQREIRNLVLSIQSKTEYLGQMGWVAGQLFSPKIIQAVRAWSSEP